MSLYISRGGDNEFDIKSSHRYHSNDVIVQQILLLPSDQDVGVALPNAL